VKSRVMDIAVFGWGSLEYRKMGRCIRNLLVGEEGSSAGRRSGTAAYKQIAHQKFVQASTTHVLGESCAALLN
jgi:hypothetical protein